ncbi:MAG: DUF4857 domain-containing protein [Opitutaceae bacterium]|jgi:hypothetical protein|nr:DUF4857 domain-containing protein [Opitutaceae bacterium]
MRHAARIFLLLTGAALLAHYLPLGWHILTAGRQRVPYVYYGDTGAGFLFTRVEKAGGDTRLIHTDAAGRALERDTFESLLPLTFHAQLYKTGAMPKEIGGVAVTPGALRREQFNLRVRPDQLDTPLVPLHPVFETDNGRARLEIPPDFMRINGAAGVADAPGPGARRRAIEFLDPKTNTILPEKSALYTDAFARARFVFPVTAAGSNPTARKPYDEGIYLADAEGQVFLLRQARGRPGLVRVADHAADPAAWRALRPRHIIVNEIETRELRALIIDAGGKPWLAVGENHRLVPLPVTRYNPAADTLSLRGNLLHRLLVVQTAAAPGAAPALEAVALDRDYRVLDRHHETLPDPAARPAARAGRVLFPLAWWLAGDTSGYLGFHARVTPRDLLPAAAALNALLLAAHLLILRRNKTLAPARLPDLAATAALGLCGLLPALLLPRAG